MHVPDGFINAPVSIAAGAIAVAGIGLCLRGARRELDDRTAPLAGLVAAFVFAGQMLNFPVAAGTSGHLLGGALAAVLVGPATGSLCVAVVLFVQVFFADGGMTALGINVTVMALVGVWTAHLVVRALLAVLPRGRTTVVAASAAGALASVLAAAMAFTAFFALGGVADVPIGAVAAAMGSVHALIGVGEALITAATVMSVISVRPDLVHAYRGGDPERLEIHVAPTTA
ncbi:MAG: cobalt/nickel transport system permease protein [Actinomycetota bacterium]|nr:cobalt/nickel transport system permease protein [Actinomycetota bacterium]